MPPDHPSTASLRHSCLPPPPPPNKSNLATALHYQIKIERKMKRNKKRIAYKFCSEVLRKMFADTYLNLTLKTSKMQRL